MLLKTEEHRIRMADVDAARVIYYASPYLWREALFTGWLYEVGHPLSEMLDSGAGCPCVSSSAEYLRPMRLDDIVRLELRSGRVGTSSFDIGMDVYDSGGAVSARVETTNVWVANSGNDVEAQPLPVWLRGLLTEEA